MEIKVFNREGGRKKKTSDERGERERREGRERVREASAREQR